MNIIPTGPPVAKEIKVFRDSERVSVVFQDGEAEDFYGRENLRLAEIALANSEVMLAADLGLTDQRGDGVIMIVPKGVMSEIFDAGSL